MKYPLTPTAKEVARTLVDLWNSDQPQQFTISITYAEDRVYAVFVYDAEYEISVSILPSLHELSKFGLIDFSRDEDSWSVLLLQELRNAVEMDFEVSEYFLTLNAVGNIIINSTTGPVQGIGLNTGNVQQSANELADELVLKLGQDFLQTQVELATAINGLRTADKPETKRLQLGKVISELGHCLQHGANAAMVIAALTTAIPFLQRVLAG